MEDSDEELMNRQMQDEEGETEIEEELMNGQQENAESELEERDWDGESKDDYKLFNVYYQMKNKK